MYVNKNFNSYLRKIYALKKKKVHFYIKKFTVYVYVFAPTLYKKVMHLEFSISFVQDRENTEYIIIIVLYFFAYIMM